MVAKTKKHISKKGTNIHQPHLANSKVSSGAGLAGPGSAVSGPAPSPTNATPGPGGQNQNGGAITIASAPLNLKTIRDFFSLKGYMLQSKATNVLNSPVLTAAHNFFVNLNTSTFFAGFVMIILNIGSRYINLNLNHSTESFVKWFMKKEVLVFAVAWMGTRNIYYAMVITACFIIIADHLMNDGSRYCILPSRFRDAHKLVDTNNDGVISDLEISKAMATLEKAKKQKEEENHVSLLQYHKLFGNDINGEKPAEKK